MDENNTIVRFHLILIAGSVELLSIILLVT